MFVLYKVSEIKIMKITNVFLLRNAICQFLGKYTQSATIFIGLFCRKGFKTSFSKHVQSESVCKAIFRWILILCLKHEKILFRGFDHPRLKFHCYCQLRKRMWILFSCQQRLHGTLEPILWFHNNCQAPKYFIMMALGYHSDISYN